VQTAFTVSVRSENSSVAQFAMHLVRSEFSIFPSKVQLAIHLVPA